MARASRHRVQLPPEAVGSADAVWPLRHPARKVSDDIGACRRVKDCKLGRGTRHHAGEDLPAPRGTVVLAPESGVVLDVRPEWYEGSGLVLLALDSGIVVNLGEIEPHSETVVPGDRVVAGQAVAKVGRHNQLHFETYAGGTRATAQWPMGEAPPAELLDPVPYLRRIAGVVDDGGSDDTPATPSSSDDPPSNPNAPRESNAGDVLVALVAAVGIGVLLESLS